MIKHRKLLSVNTLAFAHLSTAISPRTIIDHESYNTLLGTSVPNREVMRDFSLNLEQPDQPSTYLRPIINVVSRDRIRQHCRAGGRPDGQI
jgi:hypothetical protein